MGQQKQIYRKLQEVFTQDVPEVPLFYPIEFKATSGNIRNMSPLGMRGALRFPYKRYFAE